MIKKLKLIINSLSGKSNKTLKEELDNAELALKKLNKKYQDLLKESPAFQAAENVNLGKEYAREKELRKQRVAESRKYFNENNNHA
tara:strand:+ start:185 stop:442 length:258 start_codon:yes stop_codon:yes gene_type:complete